MQRGEAEIAELKERLQALQSTLNSQTTALQTEVDAKEQLAAKVASLAEVIQKKTEASGDSIKEIAQLKVDLAGADTTKKELAAQVQQIQGDLERVTAQFDQLRKDSAEKEDQTKQELQFHKDSYEESLRTISLLRDNLNRADQQLQETRKSLQQASERSTSELEASKRTNADLVRENEANAAKAAQLERELTGERSFPLFVTCFPRLLTILSVLCVCVFVELKTLRESHERAQDEEKLRASKKDAENEQEERSRKEKEIGLEKEREKERELERESAKEKEREEEQRRKREEDEKLAERRGRRKREHDDIASSQLSQRPSVRDESQDDTLSQRKRKPSKTPLLLSPNKKLKESPELEVRITETPKKAKADPVPETLTQETRKKRVCACLPPRPLSCDVCFLNGPVTL